MKPKTTFLLLLFSIIVIHSSCKDDCKGYEIPPPNWFEIKLQNEQGEDLIGTVYTQESFDLIESTTDKVNKIWRRGEENTIQIGFQGLKTNTDYYISWDENDTDTLSFKWQRIERKCHDSYELLEIKHNNLELTPGEFPILIQ